MVSNTSNPHQGQESISRNETAAQVEASRMNDTEIDDGVMQAGLKRLESSSREGNVGFLLEPSFQMLRSYYIMEKKRMPSEWRHFIFAYSDMLYAYDELGDKFLHVANQRCIELVAEARIPYLRDEMVTRLEDETEDFARKRVVRLKYQKAVEKLQDSLMPPRRRSNLPKEGVEYMKKWFRDRYDYPCKLYLFPCWLSKIILKMDNLDGRI